jgi:hypothetical protein
MQHRESTHWPLPSQFSMSVIARSFKRCLPEGQKLLIGRPRFLLVTGKNVGSAQFQAKQSELKIASYGGKFMRRTRA